MRLAQIMKTLLSFLLSTLLAVSGFSQYGQRQYGQQQYGQTVTIAFEGSNYNNAYQVLIDGTNYSNNTNGSWNRTTSNSSSDIVLSNIQPGQHTIQVYQVRNRNYGSNNATPIYSSTFILRQGYDATLSVRRNGQVQFSERQSAYNNNGRNNDRRNRGRDRDGDGDNDSRDRRYNNGGYNNGGYNNGYSNRAPMADYQFSQIYQSVKGKWFQSNKVTAVRDAFNNTSTYFSTYQITQLLQLISSESNRLQLAELSYRVVSDPANFTQVYSLFSNQSYRNELDRYIRGNRF